MRDSDEAEEVMHRPYVDIFVSPQTAGIQGTFRGIRLYRAEGSDCIVVAWFRPGAFPAFSDLPTMTKMQDKTLEVREILPDFDPGFAGNLASLTDEAAVQALSEFLERQDAKVDPRI